MKSTSKIVEMNPRSKIIEMNLIALQNSTFLLKMKQRKCSMEFFLCINKCILIIIKRLASSNKS